jgi:peptide/nickel transport system permease protein
MDELVEVKRIEIPERKKDYTALAGGIIIALFVLLAIFGPAIYPHEGLFWPTDTNWPDDPNGYTPHPPDDANWLGTVPVRAGSRQMDVLSTLIAGSRSALVFGLTAALLACFLGTLVGGISAISKLWLNDLLMRITDALLSIPVVVGVVVIQQLLLILQGGSVQTFMTHSNLSKETINLIKLINPVWMALVLFSWMPYARLTNSLVMRVKQETFVTAAIALGEDRWTILWKHLLPNTLTPVVILLAKDIGGFVLLQSSFTFIGLGGASEWGEILAYARNWIIGPGGSLFFRWWMYLPVTVALILFGTGWNLIGDAINAKLYPQAKY